MALQSSGQISLADIASEFGGSAPHSISEYYRGGSYVPSTIETVTTNNIISGSRDGNNQWINRHNGSNGYFVSRGIMANGNFIPCVNGTTYTSGTTTWYYYGGVDELQNIGNYSDPCGGPSFNQYRRYRTNRVTTTTNNTTVNTGIPSSGSTAFSQYYSGTNS